MSKIITKFYNQVHIKINTDESIYEEISDYFRFRVPDYEAQKKFNKKFKYWDGYVRMFDKRKKLLPFGLLKYLYNFSNNRHYEFELDPKIMKEKNNVSKNEFDNFIDSLNLPFKLRDYQYDASFKAINNKRITILSPTASGKSLIIYCYIQWFLQHTKNEKILLIVRKINLTQQMKGDFKDYGYKDEMHCITAGVEKNSDCRIIISTWQSLIGMCRETYMGVEKGKKVEKTRITKKDVPYFFQFGCLIIDEIHGLKNAREASSLIALADKSINAHYRFGCTGTMNEEVIHKLQIEAMLGLTFSPTTTKKLIDKGHIAPLQIRSIIIEYPDNLTKPVNNLDYEKQSEFVESTKNPRQKLIIDLANNLENNTIILFGKIEHGRFLYDELTKLTTTKEVYYIDGTTSSEDREEIREIFESNNNCVGIFSFGTMSTGANFINLHNIIFAASYKSKIRILQSIGRGLRKMKGKVAVLWDIVDFLKYPFRHYNQRLEYYIKEKFPYKEKRVNIIEWMEKNGK